MKLGPESCMTAGSERGPAWLFNRARNFHCFRGHSLYGAKGEGRGWGNGDYCGYLERVVLSMLEESQGLPIQVEGQTTPAPGYYLRSLGEQSAMTIPLYEYPLRPDPGPTVGSVMETNRLAQRRACRRPRTGLGYALPIPSSCSIGLIPLQEV
jgi:hypothetical protein